MEHFSHKHPLVLSNYSNYGSNALCFGCNDPILINTDVYHCIRRSITSQDSPCIRFFLHKTCADLPMIIQHHLHTEHVLTLSQNPWLKCNICDEGGQRFVYECTSKCFFAVCFKCAFLERQLNHPSHNHTLTLLPLKGLHMCIACGMEGSKDFSYLCQTCFFWIHKSCASAPAQLIRKDHHNDHPLVLAYSLPEEYKAFGVSCHLCPDRVFPFYWLYYCAGCRYFAHVQCALTAAESGKDVNENNNEDVEGSNLVNFPISDNQPYLLYQLIEKFAKIFSTSTHEKSGNSAEISQCHNGHSLILFDDYYDKDVLKKDTSDRRICDVCVQPLSWPPLSPPDSFYRCNDCNFDLHSVCATELPRECYNGHPLILLDDLNDTVVFDKNSRSIRICNKCSVPVVVQPNYFYGCLDCKFFLHYVCADELPRKFQHASYPENKLIRCYQASKPFDFYICNLCGVYCSGMLYSDESNPYWVDIVCAALPNKIKHDSHRHTLQLGDRPFQNCKGCGFHIFRSSFGCIFCDYYIHIKCALKPGKIKHRWDEHQLFLMYPPVKGHPHAFNCELCSEDINPNYWFYHCDKCDSSFHTFCVDQDQYSNIKYGGIVKYDDLHEHSLQLTGTRQNFKCGDCGTDRFVYYKWEPCLKCVSCKFSVCMTCIQRRSCRTVQVQ